MGQFMKPIGSSTLPDPKQLTHRPLLLQAPQGTVTVSLEGSESATKRISFSPKAGAAKARSTQTRSMKEFRLIIDLTFRSFRSRSLLAPSQAPSRRAFERDATASGPFESGSLSR